ncbi:MAG: class I SAM-dependent methyltransferase [Mycobacterium leprae]
MLRNSIAPDLLELLDPGTQEETDLYCQYARHSGGPVLVLLCGTGRIPLAIARQGVPVVGLDPDPALVETCKRKASQANLNRAMFVRGDPCRFVSDSKHPLVLIPGGGFQQMLTLEEQRQSLLAIRQAMAIGGLLVLDLPVALPGVESMSEPLLRRMGPAGERTAVIHRSGRYDPVRQTREELVACHWLDQEGNVSKTQYSTLTLRYSTPAEVLLLLENCGFTAALYGGYDRQEFLPGATRLIVEAQRKL